MWYSGSKSRNEAKSLAIYKLGQRIQRFMFAFYGLIACNPHFCETETEKEGRGKSERKTPVVGIPQARLSLLWVRCHWNDVIGAYQALILYIFSQSVWKQTLFVSAGQAALQFTLEAN